MISCNQGDTSPILVVNCSDNIDISDFSVVLSIVDMRTKFSYLKKELAYDKENNNFFTILTPEETTNLYVGKYYAVFEVRNKNFIFVQEMKDTLKIDEQYIWQKKPFSGILPAKCLYTENGSIPEENSIKCENYY